MVKHVPITTPRDHVVFDIFLRTRRCHGNTSRRGVLFKELSMTSPRLEICFENDSSWSRCLRNISEDEEISWEYISRRGVFFKEFWMIFPRHEICSPRDDIVSKILSRRGDCIGIHTETRSNIQRPFDNISPTWNIFWGWLLMIMLYSKDLSGRGDVIERRVKTRNDIQWIFINEKSSKDFSRRRLVTLRFISTRSNLRNICRRRWDVIRNFPKTWKCCWKTSPKEKVSSGFYQDENSLWKISENG